MEENMKLTKIVLSMLLIGSSAHAGFWDWLKYDNFARPKVVAAIGAISTAAYKLDIFNKLSSGITAVKDYCKSVSPSKLVSDMTQTVDIKVMSGEAVKANCSASLASVGVTALAVVSAYYGVKYLLSKCWNFLVTNRDGKTITTTNNQTATTTTVKTVNS